MRQVHGSASAVQSACRKTSSKKLNKEINVSITDLKIQARFANLGGTALGGSPADFAKLISDEVKKWSRVILAANMKRE
jgi:tripartite-type tricarboxylate transporter receptor subunit TctC